MQHLPLPPHQRAFLEQFTAACAADARVLAALLGGSYAKGGADAHSDLDLSVIVADEALKAFYASRATFLGSLGELLFLEEFDLPAIAFAIYADGTEVELSFASPGRLDQIQCGPFLPLLDKAGLLAGAGFPPPAPTAQEQHEALRRQLAWFWHDLSHCIAALGRGQLWWAHGQLEELRRCCMNLARLQHDPAAELSGHEKVDAAVPAEALAALAASCVPLERGELLRAARLLVQRYQALARPLAAANGLAYPAGLERVMLARLDRLAPG